ncbi:MAG: LssY C-terminal domain-containing protein [Xanthobacteraceae bacterium]
MRLLKRLLRRSLIFGLGVLSVWLIVFVFRFTDRRLPSVLAVALTYGVAAYLILPRAVLMGLKILHRRRVPSFTITGDGLPGDPVNLVLTGTHQQLHTAFAAAGWSPADPLCLTSSWRMIRAFLLNSSYPTAPFSTLYLFGRGQDIGFQKAIDNSPRKRHHIRFWALSMTHAEAALGTARFWLNTDRPPDGDCVHWIGAGTKDTGFSLTQLTFQVTHATDADTNAERDFIVAELAKIKVIGEVTSYRAGQRLASKQVNHYITDGEVTAATLLTES